MNKKRERLEIIHDILKSVQDKPNGARPTHILYKSNLSHQMLTEYLGELLQGGFLEETFDKKRNKNYKLTEKGHSYVADYKMIYTFIESYGLS